eukprot:gene10241-7180_t
MSRLSSASMSSSSRSKKGRLKKWELIPVPSIDHLKEVPELELSRQLLEPGFCIRFFQQDMLYLYTVASHRVLITRGVLDYLHDYNQLGPNKSRNKIFLCSEFSKENKCLNGSLCREVHCVLSIADAKDANLYGVTSNATGAPNIVETVEEEILLRQAERSTIEPLNDDASSSFESSVSSPGLDNTVVRMPDSHILRHSLHSRWTTKAMYTTLPPGVPFQVALPNTPTPVDEYDSGELFATKGAQEYYDHLVKNKLSTLSMQHCAHFTKNGICCFGEDCAFVHVVHQRQREKIDGSSSDVDTMSGGESSTSSDLGRRMKKKGLLSKETPLSIDDARVANDLMNNNNISVMTNSSNVAGPSLHFNPTANLPHHMNGNPSPDGRWFQTFSQNAQLSNPFVMMPGGNTYLQPMPAMSNSSSQPVYVLQPVYVQPNNPQYLGNKLSRIIMQVKKVAWYVKLHEFTLITFIRLVLWNRVQKKRKRNNAENSKRKCSKEKEYILNLFVFTIELTDISLLFLMDGSQVRQLIEKWRELNVELEDRNKHGEELRNVINNLKSEYTKSSKQWEIEKNEIRNTISGILKEVSVKRDELQDKEKLLVDLREKVQQQEKKNHEYEDVLSRRKAAVLHKIRELEHKDAGAKERLELFQKTARKSAHIQYISGLKKDIERVNQTACEERRTWELEQATRCWTLKCETRQSLLEEATAATSGKDLWSGVVQELNCLTNDNCTSFHPLKGFISPLTTLTLNTTVHAWIDFIFFSLPKYFYNLFVLGIDTVCKIIEPEILLSLCSSFGEIHNYSEKQISSSSYTTEIQYEDKNDALEADFYERLLHLRSIICFYCINHIRCSKKRIQSEQYASAIKRPSFLSESVSITSVYLCYLCVLLSNYVVENSFIKIRLAFNFHYFLTFNILLLRVVILDAGSQYGKVIDRRLRELHVCTEILPSNTPVEGLSDESIKGIIISGGPNSVYDSDAPPFDSNLFNMEKPILGICYGMQLMCHTFGGLIEKGKVREDGQDTISVDPSAVLFTGLEEHQQVLLTHGDSITDPGNQLSVTARSSSHIIAAVQHNSKALFGVQFHPEVELSKNGTTMLQNFLTYCGCSFSYTMEDRESTAIREIKERTAGGEKVLCLVSGGVDSSVCAALLLKALGPERVVCVHIDHGFMRLNESASVIKALTALGVPVHLVNAAESFSTATTQIPAKGSREEYTTQQLSSVVDPEEKRNIIGNTFITVSNEAIRNLHLETQQLLLAQGTLRPDLIESGSAHASKRADAIKTHHNDTSVVRALRDAGKIIEPLKDYHKDEVRELGHSLGLPRELVERQPFPGPGLAIRVLCSDGKPIDDPALKSTEMIAKDICGGQSDLIEGDLKLFIQDNRIESCVLPIRTVGVQGDGRTYAFATSLSLGRFPSEHEWEKLLQLAKQIPKVAHSVNRVVYTFGSGNACSPPSPLPTTLTVPVLDMLRVADNIVNSTLIKFNLLRKLSQVPVVLIPISMENDEKRSVVIRTFISNDFMTGVPAQPGSEYLPLAALQEMVDALLALPFVSRPFLRIVLTSKNEEPILIDDMGNIWIIFREARIIAGRGLKIFVVGIIVSFDITITITFYSLEFLPEDSQCKGSNSEYCFPVKQLEYSDSGNRFAVTDTRRSWFASNNAQPHPQQDEVSAFHRMKHAEMLEKWERDNCMSVKDKEKSLKFLVAHAAARGISICRTMDYDHSIMKFVKDTWMTLLKQTELFFETAVDSEEILQRLTEGLEIISSLGIWYSTMNTSLPLRRFLVYFPNESGEVKPHIVVGLLSFSYSSYIMEVRKESQLQVLEQLETIKQDLASDCLFLPELLVSPPSIQHHEKESAEGEYNYLLIFVVVLFKFLFCVQAEYPVGILVACYRRILCLTFIIIVIIIVVCL